VHHKTAPSWDVYSYNCSCNACKGRDVYIGTAKWGFVSRDKTHRWIVSRLLEGRAVRAQAFHHLIVKHGYTNIQGRVLLSCDNREKMYATEIDLIADYHTHVSQGGINIHIGGKGGTVTGSTSIHTRKKMSVSLKAWHALNPQAREIAKAGRDKWLAADSNNASKRAQKAWETKRQRQASDPVYAEKQHKLAVTRGRMGKAAQMKGK
jgi:hypothetical protein